MATIKIYDYLRDGNPALWLEQSEDGALTLNDTNMGVEVADEDEADAEAEKVQMIWKDGN